MNNKGSILAIDNDPELLGKLESAVTKIGYEFSGMSLSKIEINSIISLAPRAILVGLTEWDEERRIACETLLGENRLNGEIPVVAIISENSLLQVPAELNFAELVVSPCPLPELDFRLDRIIKRYQQKTSQGLIAIDDLSINLASCEAKVKGNPVTMTFREFELIKHLIINRGHVYTRHSLLNIVWGNDYHGGVRTVDVHIRRIREKIGDEGEKYIKTVRNIGYAFRAEATEESTHAERP